METKNKKDTDSRKQPSRTKTQSAQTEKTESAAKARGKKKTDNGAGTGSVKRMDSTVKKTSTEAKNSRKTARTAKSSGKPEAEKTARRREIDVPDIRRAPGTPVFAEIFLWILIALCLILFLNNIFAFGVTALDAVSGFFFGIFGVCAFLAPLLLVFLAAFIVANRASLPSWVKSGAIFILFLCICALTELLSGTFDGTRIFSDYFTEGKDYRAGGGVAGALLCRMLCPVFGQVGAWILLIVLLIICAIIITGHSLFDNLRRNGSRAYRRARAGSQAKRELHDLKKERNQMEKQRRMQKEIEKLRSEEGEIQLEVRRPRRAHIVSGVMEDTRLDPHLPASEEIHEVVPRMYRRSGTAENGGAFAKAESVPSGSMQTEAAQAKVRIADASSEASHPVKSGRAKKMVDSVNPQKPKQMDLSFTIQRDGVSENVEIPAFSVAELESENGRSGIPQMPDTTPPALNTAVQEPAADRHPARNPKSSREEQEKELEGVAQEIALSEEQPKPAYVFPPLDLLTKPSRGRGDGSNSEVKETAAKLQQTLHNFGVNVNVTNVSCGPAVTRYELTPEQGVKVSRIVNLSDDIKLNLAASDIRIEAPIPGKSAVGIEVPNKENSAVLLRELLESEEFKNAKSNLSFAVGKDIAGKVVVADIAKMPHLLIAGATGSGKSVCINTLIMSILYKADPEDVKLIMIDPKVVELSVYNGIPHLFIPVVTDPKKASGALNWGVAEMTDRYQKFAECGVRDLKGYNEKISHLTDVPEEQRPKKLPQIVIIVDELADLMMVAPGEVEDAICRLAQLARAAGIHLIIATQRPSVNVITGLIKANMPSRIAFSVTSGVDSRTIIDMNGAEKLLGKGDMLFYPQGYQKPARVQGAFVSDKEVGNVTDFLTKKNDVSGYKQEMEERMTQVAQASVSLPGASGGGNELDANFAEAGRFIIEKDKASIGMLQRVFKIGFNRAARIMDQLSDAGVVGPEEGTKPRKILMTMEEFEKYIDEYV